MHFAKLFDLLNLFSSKDWKRCEFFMETPFFGNHDDLREFFQYLKRNKNKIKDRPDFFTKERVQKKLHPKLKCHFKGNELSEQPDSRKQDNSLRKLSSDLTKKIEKYLAIEYQLANELLLMPSLLRAIEKRKSFELLVKKADELERNLNRKSIPEELYSDIYFELSYRQFLYDYKATTKENFGQPDSLSSALLQLNVSYLIKCLKIFLFLKNRNNTLNEENELPWKEQALAIAAQFLEKNNYIKLLHGMLQYKMDKAEPEQLRALILLFREVDHLHISEHNGLLRILANYAIDGYRKGMHPFRSMLVDIYEIGMDKEILTPRDVILPGFFLNVVTTVLTEWEAETDEKRKRKLIELYRRFRRNYERFLPEEDYEKVKVFSDAMLFWNRGQVDRALRLLRDFKAYPVQYQLRYRSLQLVCWFDFVPSGYEEEDFFDNSLQRFRQYLKRPGLTPNPARLKNYQVFVDCIGRLKQIVTHHNCGIDLEQLETQIRSQNMVYKDWLLKKVDQLKNGKLPGA